MTVITDAKNARYGDDGIITADVRFDDLTAPDGTPLYLPYTSTAYDPADFGAQLYSDLKSGKYGLVTPFTVKSEMIQAAKDQKHGEINIWRNIQEDTNYVFQFNDRNWDYGRATQERLSLSVQMAKQNRLPAGFIWTDADNNDVPMASGELLNLSDAIDQVMFKKGLEIHLRQRQMKEEVDALSYYQAIKDYVVGWTKEGEAGNDKAGTIYAAGND